MVSISHICGGHTGVREEEKKNGEVKGGVGEEKERRDRMRGRGR